MKKLIAQIFKFGIVGIVCTLIDYGIMVFLTEVFHVNYLISSGISFTISVIVNYLLSMRYVFETAQDRDKKKEFLIFVILSVLGLGLNQLLMWLCVDKLHIYYMLAKIIATAIVMVYNFITRKLILEEHK
ncbi:MAG: GtrA family protein [Lachnospiraceae bacterium]|nr:GtrA family protein [Lachnospiraceae bacterium]